MTHLQKTECLDNISSRTFSNLLYERLNVYVIIISVSKSVAMISKDMTGNYVVIDEFIHNIYFCLTPKEDKSSQFLISLGSNSSAKSCYHTPETNQIHCLSRSHWIFVPPSFTKHCLRQLQISLVFAPPDLQKTHSRSLIYMPFIFTNFKNNQQSYSRLYKFPQGSTATGFLSLNNLLHYSSFFNSLYSTNCRVVCRRNKSV